MKLFYSFVIVCYVKLQQVFFLSEKNAFSFMFYLHQNELTAYYQQTICRDLQIPYLKHFQFPQRPYLDKS